MKAIFIADLHLKVEDTTPLHKRFERFTQEIKDKYDALYILGDLFAYWYEHPDIEINYDNEVFRYLNKLSESKTDVYFIYGNRDFMASSGFKEKSGVKFVGDKLIINENGRKIHLSHGDDFAKKDYRYRIWRSIVRFPLAKFAFKLLPVGLAISVVDRFKNVGKKAPIAEKIIADMIVKSASEMLEKEVDVIITGHAHIETYKTFTVNDLKKELFILPEFSYPGKYLVMEDGRFSFVNIG